MCVSATATRTLCNKVRRLQSKALPCFFSYPPSFEPNLDPKPMLWPQGNKCQPNVTIYFFMGFQRVLQTNPIFINHQPKVQAFFKISKGYLLVIRILWMYFSQITYLYNNTFIKHYYHFISIYYINYFGPVLLFRKFRPKIKNKINMLTEYHQAQ